MLGPLAPYMHSFAAQGYAFAKRYDRAIAHYEQALAFDPQRQKAWRAVGFLYSETADPSNAIRTFREAIRLDPSDYTTRFNLGFLHHARNEFDAAIEQFEAAIKLSPALDRAWYGLGAIHLERGELDLAIERLKEAARIQYFNPHAAQLLVRAYQRAGKQSDAIEELNRLNGFDPKAAAATAAQTGFKLLPKK